MIEKHFYADVDKPFHVWVRERCGAHGYRWVLRDASHLDKAAGQAHASSGSSGSGRRPAVAPGAG